MRLDRAIEKFLAQMEVEQDWTARTIDSYYRVLIKLVDDFPDTRVEDFEGRAGTEKLRKTIARRWGKAAAGTRATRISTFHSFFSWAEDEGLLEDDPARRIKRPPRRRADVYRPPPADVELGYRATRIDERAAWILLSEVGLRASTVVAMRWQDVDLTRGRVHVRVKGGHRDVLPLRPIGLERLRAVYREIEPDPDDHVFTVEHHRFAGNRRLVYTRDPKRAASPKSLWEMVNRVCGRAGVRRFGPHALRHGFGTAFLRDSDRDVVSLQQLFRHAKLETTLSYTDELRLEELEEALRRADERRTSVASRGDGQDDPGEDALEDADGPGWNRTTGPSSPADRAEPPRTFDARTPAETSEKECHDVE